MLRAQRADDGTLYNIRDAARDRGRGTVILPFATFAELDAHGPGPYTLEKNIATPRADQIQTAKPSKAERRELARRRAFAELADARARELDPEAFAP